ncbi:MAG: hypothetical protein JWP31_244 [Aeromicrobium sp.]|nr:hypothetical protein [Aeromicrobium sp.]
MTQRGRRRKLVVVSALQGIIGIVLVVMALTIVNSPAERDEIRAADRVATRYLQDLESYRQRSVETVLDEFAKDPDDYPDLLKTVEATTAAAPEVPRRGTTAFGRAHSDDYRSTAKRRAFVLQPWTRLADYLRDGAVPASRFVRAGKKLVNVDPSKILEGVFVFNGAPLRDLVRPAFEKARAQVRKTAAPQGADLLKRDLLTYADDALKLTDGGAESIDRGEPFFFEFGTRPDRLLERLAAVEASIQQEALARADLLTAGGTS